MLVAASNDDAAQVRQLLKAGANPNVRNKLDTTPLLEAAFHSNLEIIEALLDAGADPNVAGADGQTPLMLVARGTNVVAAKMLLGKGANPKARESQRQQTALMWAAANSQGPMTRLLVEVGADVDAKTATDLMTPLVSGEPRAQPRSPGGMTALMFASREGCLDCVAAMIEKGAAVNLPDPEGVTPLLWAIWNTRFDVAKYLIEHGADVNRWDWWGRTPLYLAVDYVTLPHGGRPDQPSLDETLPIEIVRLLLEKGADPNPQLKMTAPLRATGNDRGLDPMLSPGTTPLIRAAKAMDVESMKALLEHGADISLTTQPQHDGDARRLRHGLDGRGYAWLLHDIGCAGSRHRGARPDVPARRPDQRQGRPVCAGPAARGRLLGLESRGRIPAAEGRGDQPCRQPRLHCRRLRDGPGRRQQPRWPTHRRPQGHGGPADVEGRRSRKAQSSKLKVS